MAKRPRRCRKCDRSADEVGLISRNGLCLDCSFVNQIENVRQMRDRSGPYYERWLRGTYTAAESTLRDLHQQREAS